METLLSQMQQFGQGSAQLWQDQVARWGRATEAAFAAQRAWLDQMHELYARFLVVPDGVANGTTPPRA